MSLSALLGAKRSAIFTAVVLAASVPVQAHVVLEAPNGGETFEVGSTQEVRWRIAIAHNLQNWDLWYSTTSSTGPWVPMAVDLPAGSGSVGSIHTYAWTIPNDASATVFVRVRMDNSATDYLDVSDGALTITDAVGTNYCVGALNSAGLNGKIHATGSVLAADNNLILSTEDAAPNKSGIFFYGTNQVQAPLGDGFRCVGGNVQRLYPLIMTDGIGVASRTLDLSSGPALGDITSLAPITMNFQFWHRDSMGSSNLTDGISISFQ